MQQSFTIALIILGIICLPLSFVFFHIISYRNENKRDAAKKKAYDLEIDRLLKVDKPDWDNMIYPNNINQ
jgi:hypothetical protein